MEEELAEDEVCKQLLELAQTPEQINYITSNNTTILMQKIEGLKALIEDQDRDVAKIKMVHYAKEQTYMKVIMSLAYQKYSDYD
jgi:hypothetical protein